MSAELKEALTAIEDQFKRKEALLNWGLLTPYVEEIDFPSHFRNSALWDNLKGYEIDKDFIRSSQEFRKDGKGKSLGLAAVLQGFLEVVVDSWQERDKLFATECYFLLPKESESTLPLDKYFKKDLQKYILSADYQHLAGMLERYPSSPNLARLVIELRDPSEFSIVTRKGILKANYEAVRDSGKAFLWSKEINSRHLVLDMLKINPDLIYEQMDPEDFLYMFGLYLKTPKIEAQLRAIMQKGIQRDIAEGRRISAAVMHKIADSELLGVSMLEGLDPIKDMELGKYILTEGFMEAGKFLKTFGDSTSARLQKKPPLLLKTLDVPEEKLIKRLIYDLKLYGTLEEFDSLEKITFTEKNILALLSKTPDIYRDLILSKIRENTCFSERVESYLADILDKETNAYNIEDILALKGMKDFTQYGVRYYYDEESGKYTLNMSVGQHMEKLFNKKVSLLTQNFQEKYKPRPIYFIGDLLSDLQNIPLKVAQDILEKELLISNNTDWANRTGTSGIENHLTNYKNLFTSVSADIYLKQIKKNRIISFITEREVETGEDIQGTIALSNALVDFAKSFNLDLKDYGLEIFEEYVGDLEDIYSRKTKKELGLENFDEKVRITPPRYKNNKPDLDIEYAQTLIGEAKERGLNSFTAMDVLKDEYTKDQISVFNKFLLDNLGKQKVSLDELQLFIDSEHTEDPEDMYNVGLSVWKGDQRYLDAPNLVLQLNVKKEHLSKLFLEKQSEIDPVTGKTFEEWFTDVGEMFHQSGHPVLPIPGRTVGWARIHLLDEKTWLINEIQEDWGQLRGALVAIAKGHVPHGLNEEQAEILAKGNGAEWTQYVIDNLLREYEVMLMRMILTTARRNGIKSIYMLPDAVQTHIMSDSKRKILYRELPKRFKFKLKNVDLEEKYNVNLVEYRPTSNTYWHRVAKIASRGDRVQTVLRMTLDKPDIRL